jgi:hypothetical protein
MTSTLPQAPENTPSVDRLPNPRSRHDRFRFTKFTEATDSVMVKLAREIHAVGYQDMGFVNSSAVTSEGFLADDIDKAHGPNVDYYVAESPDDDEVKATLRKIHIPEGGSLQDLPAFNLTIGSLSDSGFNLIAGIDNPEVNVKEIAALARTPEASPMIIFELLRNVLHESLGKDEVWFFSIVSTTYQSLVDNFGNEAIYQIGEPITFDDTRISNEVTLVPALVNTDTFINTLCRTALDETDPDQQQRLLRSFMFFTDGLDDSQMNVEASSVRSSINSMLALKKGA